MRITISFPPIWDSSLFLCSGGYLAFIDWLSVHPYLLIEMLISIHKIKFSTTTVKSVSFGVCVFVYYNMHIFILQQVV